MKMEDEEFKIDSTILSAVIGPQEWFKECETAQNHVYKTQVQNVIRFC